MDPLIVTFPFFPVNWHLQVEGKLKMMHVFTLRKEKKKKREKIEKKKKKAYMS